MRAVAQRELPTKRPGTELIIPQYPLHRRLNVSARVAFVMPGKSEAWTGTTVRFLSVVLQVHIMDETNDRPAAHLKLQPAGFLHLHRASHPPD